VGGLRNSRAAISGLVALAREDRIRGNPQWVSEALAEPSAPRPAVTPSWVNARHPGPVTRTAQRRPDCRHTLCREPIDRLGRSRIAVHLAGARLVYGGMAAPRAPASGSASTCGPPAESPLPKVFSKLGISSAGSSGTTWRWRNPAARRLRPSPRTASSSGPAPGTSTDASAPQRGRRCVGNPSRTGPARTMASNPMRDSQMVNPRRKPWR
jgi:hypothetical protein